MGSQMKRRVYNYTFWADFCADQHVFAPWGKELADENKPYIKGENRGTPGGIRTPNLLIRSQMLYPLSYGRKILRTLSSARKA